MQFIIRENKDERGREIEKLIERLREEREVCYIVKDLGLFIMDWRPIKSSRDLLF